MDCYRYKWAGVLALLALLSGCIEKPLIPMEHEVTYTYCYPFDTVYETSTTDSYLDLDGFFYYPSDTDEVVIGKNLTMQKNYQGDIEISDFGWVKVEMNWANFEGYGVDTLELNNVTIIYEIKLNKL